jgi:excisionase family DNA binding protein
VSAEEQSVAAFVNVGDVPQEEIPAVLGRVLTVGAALFARLAVPQASATPTLDPLLTAEQVASQLGLPAPRVYEMARQGVLPFVRIGKKLVRFEQTAIGAWVAAHRVTAGTVAGAPALSLVPGKRARKERS